MSFRAVKTTDDGVIDLPSQVSKRWNRQLRSEQLLAAVLKQAFGAEGVAYQLSDYELRLKYSNTQQYYLHMLRRLSRFQDVRPTVETLMNVEIRLQPQDVWRRTGFRGKYFAWIESEGTAVCTFDCRTKDMQRFQSQGRVKIHMLALGDELMAFTTYKGTLQICHLNRNGATDHDHKIVQLPSANTLAVSSCGNAVGVLFWNDSSPDAHVLLHDYNSGQNTASRIPTEIDPKGLRVIAGGRGGSDRLQFKPRTILLHTGKPREFTIIGSTFCDDLTCLIILRYTITPTTPQECHLQSHGLFPFPWQKPPHGRPPNLTKEAVHTSLSLISLQPTNHAGSYHLIVASGTGARYALVQLHEAVETQKQHISITKLDSPHGYDPFGNAPGPQGFGALFTWGDAIAQTYFQLARLGFVCLQSRRDGLQTEPVRKYSLERDGKGVPFGSVGEAVMMGDERTVVVVEEGRVRFLVFDRDEDVNIDATDGSHDEEVDEKRWVASLDSDGVEDESTLGAAVTGVDLAPYRLKK